MTIEPIVHGCTRRASALAAIVIAMSGFSSPTYSKTLIVGPDQKLKVPSAAAAEAVDGDLIQIEPARDKVGYFDCAVWRANRLTIEGRGEGVVLTDKTCQGKAIFVTVGNDITVRNLTLTRARVPDQNGAGIRAEGANLRVERSRFINNQDGILAAPSANSVIIVVDSEFIGNGVCISDCAHAIYVNEARLLRIEHSIFRDTHEGHAVKSRARRTELIANTIIDGETGTSSYLVDIPNGGALVMRDNVLQKGPKSSNHTTAVSVGEEGVEQPTEEITIAGNKFANDMKRRTLFVLNVTATEAKLTGNAFSGQVVPLSGNGSNE
jgi:hypothetical protein